MAFNRLLLFPTSLLFAFSLSSCSSKNKDFDASLKARSFIKGNSENSGIKGAAKFFFQDGIVIMKAKIIGLTPNSKHGFHIHENGECIGDFKGAGGHFSPNEESVHSSYDNPHRHAGDLGNITADEKGIVLIKRELPGLHLSAAQATSFSLIQRTLIIHAGEDDLESQPHGNAGDRVACGIIKNYN